MIGLAQFYQNGFNYSLHVLSNPFVFSFWLSPPLCPLSHLSCVLFSTMLESYSALLKSLQEVIHREGFDVAAPMVSTTSESLLCFCFFKSEFTGFLPHIFCNYNLLEMCLSNYCQTILSKPTHPFTKQQSNIQYFVCTFVAQTADKAAEQEKLSTSGHESLHVKLYHCRNPFNQLSKSEVLKILKNGICFVY